MVKEAFWLYVCCHIENVSVYETPFCELTNAEAPYKI